MAWRAARGRMNWETVRSNIQDLIFPRAEPVRTENIEGYRRKSLAEAEELLGCDDSLDDVDHECRKLLELEESRRAAVEARLTSVMGLASVAGTVLFAGIYAE